MNKFKNKWALILAVVMMLQVIVPLAGLAEGDKGEVEATSETVETFKEGHVDEKEDITRDNPTGKNREPNDSTDGENEENGESEEPTEEINPKEILNFTMYVKWNKKSSDGVLDDSEETPRAIFQLMEGGQKYGSIRTAVGDYDGQVCEMGWIELPKYKEVNGEYVECDYYVQLASQPTNYLASNFEPFNFNGNTVTLTFNGEKLDPVPTPEPEVEKMKLKFVANFVDKEGNKILPGKNIGTVKFPDNKIYHVGLLEGGGTYEVNKTDNNELVYNPIVELSEENWSYVVKQGFDKEDSNTFIVEVTFKNHGDLALKQEQRQILLTLNWNKRCDDNEEKPQVKFDLYQNGETLEGSERTIIGEYNGFVGQAGWFVDKYKVNEKGIILVDNEGNPIENVYLINLKEQPSNYRINKNTNDLNAVFDPENIDEPVYEMTYMGECEETPLEQEYKEILLKINWDKGCDNKKPAPFAEFKLNKNGVLLEDSLRTVWGENTGDETYARWEVELYALDENGNVKVDEKGNPVENEYYIHFLTQPENYLIDPIFDSEDLDNPEYTLKYDGPCDETPVEQEQREILLKINWDKGCDNKDPAPFAEFKLNKNGVLLEDSLRTVWGENTGDETLARWEVDRYAVDDKGNIKIDEEGNPVENVYYIQFLTQPENYLIDPIFEPEDLDNPEYTLIYDGPCDEPSIIEWIQIKAYKIWENLHLMLKGEKMPEVYFQLFRYVKNENGAAIDQENVGTPVAAVKDSSLAVNWSAETHREDGEKYYYSVREVDKNGNTLKMDNFKSRIYVEEVDGMVNIKVINTYYQPTTPGNTPVTPPGDTDKPGDTDTDKPGDTDIDKPGDTDIDKPGDTDIDKPGDTDIDKPGDTDIDKPGDTDIDKPGDTDIDKPVDTDTDKPGDTEKPVKPVKPVAPEKTDKEKAEKKALPKTGSVAPYAMYVGLALAGIGGVAFKKKRK